MKGQNGYTAGSKLRSKYSEIFEGSNKQINGSVDSIHPFELGSKGPNNAEFYGQQFDGLGPTPNVTQIRPKTIATMLNLGNGCCS